MFCFFKSGIKRTFKTGNNRPFSQAKTCLGMRDITLRLTLIQSLVVQLKIYEIKKLGTLNFAATPPMLPKHCEQNLHIRC